MAQNESNTRPDCRHKKLLSARIRLHGQGLQWSVPRSAPGPASLQHWAVGSGPTSCALLALTYILTLSNLTSLKPSPWPFGDGLEVSIPTRSLCGTRESRYECAHCKACVISAATHVIKVHRVHPCCKLLKNALTTLHKPGLQEAETFGNAYNFPQS